MLERQEKRYRRHKRVRAKIFGTAKVPRLCVFRSAKHIYAQLIDDEKGKTLEMARDFELKVKSPASAKATAGKKKPKTKVREEKIDEAKKPLSGKAALAFGVGKLIAEKAKKLKIERVVFDRGGYAYHGRVKALADGAREGGLKF